MALPLEGIKILDLSTMLPGPFCSMILADFGAEVIKVEAVKGGDLFRGGVPKIGDTGGAFFQVNRNKKSITLNLKSEEGKEIFYKLAKDADVVLEQYRPGVVKKLGVDYETIKAINPKIVYCSLSGYGQTGPYRLTSGHDLNYISYAGILGLTARKGQTPTIPGVQIADIGGGALYAAIGILIALMGVKQNGVGQYVDTSMLDGAVSWLPVLANDYFVKGVSPKAAENILNGQNACYEVYETADGRYISIGAIEPHLWANFCDAIGKEEFKQGSVLDQSFDMDIAQKFAGMNIYSRPKCQKCWAKFYCSGGCSAANYNMNHDMNDSYDLGCEMERKRLECAIYLKAMDKICAEEAK